MDFKPLMEAEDLSRGLNKDEAILKSPMKIKGSILGKGMKRILKVSQQFWGTDIWKNN